MCARHTAKNHQQRGQSRANKRAKANNANEHQTNVHKYTKASANKHALNALVLCSKNIHVDLLTVVLAATEPTSAGCWLYTTKCSPHTINWQTNSNGAKYTA